MSSNRRPLGLLLSLFAVSVAASASGSGEKSATFTPGGRVHKLPMRSAGSGVRSSAPTDPDSCKSPGCHMLYYGGKIIANPKVYTVLWGASVDPAISSAMPDVFRATTNSAWMDWLNEYSTTVLRTGGPGAGGSGSNQSAGRGTYAGQYQITPANTGSPLLDTQIASELNAQIDAGHLPLPDENAIYMVYFAPGQTIQDGPDSVSCVKFCAFHSTFTRNGKSVYFGVMPDFGAGSGCDTGCGPQGTEIENLSAASAHELIEAVTDAEVGVAPAIDAPLGWYDNANGEVGDMCNQHQDTVVSLVNGQSYTVQQIFSNKAAAASTPACVTTRYDANDFTVFANPNLAQLAPGGSVAVPITTALTNGGSQALTLSVSGMPAGVTAAFNHTSVFPGQAAVLTLTAASGAAHATDAVIVVQAAGATTHTASVLLNVGAVANDFSVSLAPGSRQLATNGTATCTLTTASTHGTAETLTLSVGGLPAGVSGSFDQSTVTAGGTATLTLTASGAGAMTSQLVVTADSASVSHSALATLVVGPGSPNDFAFALTPATKTGGSSGATTYTVTTGLVFGTAESIVLSATGLPDGFTAAFAPAAITAGSTSTLTLTGTGAASPGSHTFTITGTAGSATHDANATLVVVSSDFTLTLVQTNTTLSAGKTATITVNTGSTAGSPQPIALSASGLPTGVTASFAPANITANQTSTLTLTAANNLSSGSATVTVTATGSATTHTATEALTDLTLPTAAISSPLGASSQSRTVHVTATATVSAGTTLTQLAVLVDGVSIGTQTSSPATIDWDSTHVTNGAHALTARATDQAGNVTTSAAVSVSISNAAAPTVAVTAPVGGATVSGSVTITAAATVDPTTTLTGLSVSVDGQSIATGTSGSLTSSWDSSLVADGQHSITAQATDANGRTTTSAVVTVTVGNAGKGGCSSSGGGFEVLGLFAIAGFLRRRRGALH